MDGDAFDARLGALLGAGLSERVKRVCESEGTDVARFCAAAVERATRAVERRKAPAAAALSEATLAELRVKYAEAHAAARDWDGLHAALAAFGLAIAPAGGGLELRVRSSGARLAKASEGGPGYMALIRKFKAGMPGHPHVWIAERALSGRSIYDKTTRESEALVVYET